MPFRGSNEVEQRLKDPARLRPNEVRDLMEWMHQITESGIRRLNAELALQNLEAIQESDRSSRRLTWWVIALTVVLVALTGLMAYLTVLLVRLPKR